VISQKTLEALRPYFDKKKSATSDQVLEGRASECELLMRGLWRNRKLSWRLHLLSQGGKLHAVRHCAGHSYRPALDRLVVRDGPLAGHQIVCWLAADSDYLEHDFVG